MSRLIWHRVRKKLIAIFSANFSLKKVARSEVDGCHVATSSDAWRIAALTVADDDLYASQLASLSSQDLPGSERIRLVSDSAGTRPLPK
jgi:hypothetical protein